MIQDPVLVLAFMLGVVAFTRWLEGRFDWVKKISSAVVCTLLGIVLANVGLIEHTGPMHAAAALGTPVVVPFGSTSIELTGPGLPGAGWRCYAARPALEAKA